MALTEKLYQISFYGKTNMENNKYICLSDTGYYLEDFRFKIINKILKCTISSTPIIVFNDKNEYFIVCDTDDIREIFKEWISIDSNIMLKIISIKPSLFTFTENKNTILNFYNLSDESKNNNDFNDNNLNNVNNSIKNKYFSLNPNAPVFIPKEIRLFQI